MMIYIFGDLRQLRSFELVRPPISLPQRLRPLRGNTTSIRHLPREPEPWLVPITCPPILPKPVHDPEKSSPSPRFLSPILEPVSSNFSSNTGLQADTINPRVTSSSVCSGSFASCDSGDSRTSTSSSEEVEIHISEAFYDIEPPYFHDDLMASSPVPSSWQGESPSNTSRTWTPPRGSYNTDSALLSSPGSRKFPSPADNLFRPTDTRTSTTSDRAQEKWIPTAGFIRPFEHNEWEEWDGQSVMYTADGSLGGYGAGDEESRISHFVRPTGLRQDEPRTVGMKVPIQFRTRARRGTIVSSRVSQELGTFDFDALPAFRAPPSPAVAPALQRRPRYRTCDASPPPPPHGEANLTETGTQQGVFRTWLVDLPMLFIRRTQGKCGAAKQVIKDILSKSAGQISRRNGGQDGSEYHDAPETQDGEQCLPVATDMYQDPGFDIPNLVPQPFPHSHSTVSRLNEKGKVKENWRVRWKRALSVPAFRTPLTKILSPVVTRAQWEVVVRSGALAFVTSFVVIAIIVAVPVP